jgi:hypothetical protein
MHIDDIKRDRKSRENDYQFPPNTDRVAQQIAEKFALTLPHAREVARLAGLGGEARR